MFWCPIEVVLLVSYCISRIKLIEMRLCVLLVCQMLVTCIWCSLFMRAFAVSTDVEDIHGFWYGWRTYDVIYKFLRSKNKYSEVAKYSILWILISHQIAIVLSLEHNKGVFWSLLFTWGMWGFQSHFGSAFVMWTYRKMPCGCYIFFHQFDGGDSRLETHKIDSIPYCADSSQVKPLVVWCYLSVLGPPQHVYPPCRWRFGFIMILYWIITFLCLRRA